ncbi:MAG: DUF1829 domain-containing protein [Rhodanobacteraceae bacterium]|nr:MAG: DUF1829 domain-containing protein [Rhodanobacteraceae bacterium]
MNTTGDLVDRYYAWLKAKTSWRETRGWTEITTPYLDRHNDYIQLYLREANGEFVLTDDGYTIADLAQSGCALDTAHRKALLQSTLNGFGVQMGDGAALEVKATPDTFALRKHSMLQAILAINDLFYVARPNVENFFFEDVALWLDGADIRYMPRVSFTGHSRYTHQFDFAIPKSRNQPERLLRVINNPNKDNAQNTAFAWVDTKEARPVGSIAYAVLNDDTRAIGEAVLEALTSYDINPLPWSKREEFRDKLAA